MIKVIALFLLALLGGMSGGYFLPQGEEVASAKPRSEAKREPIVAAEVESAPVAVLEQHAAKSVEDLITFSGSSRLLRMTLWLIDASSDEIGELWETLDAQDALDHKTNNILMIHWVERDPRAAIAAARNSGMESVAWWAWGRADPEEALEVALQESPWFAANVLRSVGQFHLDLALRLMEKHPEALGGSAVEGIGSGLAKEDPRRAVEFLRTRGKTAGDELKTWVERDPDAALAWVRQNMTGASGYEVNGFFEELVIEHPERVPAWLETLPSGAMRRSLAMEHCRSLCGRDLTAAIAFARSQEGLRTKRDLMALVGIQLAHEGPAASIALLREARSLVGETPPSEALSSATTGRGSIANWTPSLLRMNPDGLVRMAAADLTEDNQAPLLGMLANWIRWDEVEFAEWLIDHEPGPVRELGIAELSRQLMAHTNPAQNKPPDFESSLHWASTLDDPQGRSMLMSNTIRTWVSNDPEGAAEYFEAA